MADPRSNQPRAAILTSSAFVSLTTVARQSGWWPYCLIQKCSRTVRALPHQKCSPVPASLWQSVPDGKQRLPPKRSHRLGAGPGPACPGGGERKTRFPVRSASLLSRPDLAPPEPRRATEGMGGAEPPGATRSALFRASMRLSGWGAITSLPASECRRSYAAVRVQRDAAHWRTQPSTLTPNWGTATR